MDPKPPAEHEQGEPQLFTLERCLQTALPLYSDIDWEIYNTYDKAKDTLNRGQILTLFTEQGREKTDPRLMFIFRPTGFVINYYNSAEPSNPYSIRNPGNSVYGKREQRWQPDEIEFAIERTKIHMEGLDLDNPAFYYQFVGWDPEKNHFYTMGNRMDARKEFVDMQKTSKKRSQAEWRLSINDTIWNTYDKYPEQMRQLAKLRIQSTPTYKTFEGAEIESSEVIRWIEEKNVLGERAVQREMYKIESYERLLKDHNLL